MRKYQQAEDECTHDENGMLMVVGRDFTAPFPSGARDIFVGIS